jgi:hypothetical protein
MWHMADKAQLALRIAMSVSRRLLQPLHAVLRLGE